MLARTQDTLIAAVFGLLLGACLPTACWIPSVSAAPPTSLTKSTLDTDQVGQRKIISVWTHMLPGGIEGDVFTKTVSAYEQAQDEYTIEVVPIAPETYADRIIGSAQSGSLPCVLEFDGPYLYNFVWSGYLQPIDRFVSSQLKADLLPSILAQATYNGQLYSVGQFDTGMMIYGNRRYLQAAGVRIATFDEPWSLAEFEEALERLTALPEVAHAIDMKVNYGRSEFYSYGFAPILQSFGGDLIDRSTYQQAGGVLDGPRSVEAMQHFQSWFDKGWAGKSTATDNDFYGTKKAALAWVGAWMYKPHAEGLGEDLVVMPLPDFGAGPKATMGNWAWSISSNCQDPSGAWRFIEFLLSPEEMLRMTDESGGAPSRRSVLAESELYSESGPLHLIWQQLDSDRIVPRPITPAYATISRVFAEAVDNIINGADVKTELTQAAQEIDRDIKAHQGYPIN
ncbi:MAG: sugar ABC transporter substrate-binding protein [Candidatus Thiodiazotropha sp. 6PLUC9]